MSSSSDMNPLELEIVKLNYEMRDIISTHNEAYDGLRERNNALREENDRLKAELARKDQIIAELEKKEAENETPNWKGLSETVKNLHMMMSKTYLMSDMLEKRVEKMEMEAVKKDQMLAEQAKEFDFNKKMIVSVVERCQIYEKKFEILEMMMAEQQMKKTPFLNNLHSELPDSRDKFVQFLNSQMCSTPIQPIQEERTTNVNINRGADEVYVPEDEVADVLRGEDVPEVARGWDPMHACNKCFEYRGLN